jgi:hypothetical protein
MEKKFSVCSTARCLLLTIQPKSRSGDAYAIYRITANGVNKSAALVAVWRLVASKLPATSLHFTHSIVRRFEAEQSPRDGLTSNLTLRANLHTGTLHTRFPCAVDDE